MMVNCTEDNGIKIEPPTNNYLQCISYGYICQEPYFSNQFVHNSWIYTPKDDARCSFAGGVRVPVNVWKNATWMPGQLRSLYWKERKYLPRYNLTNGFDFFLLNNAISNAIQDKYTFILQSNSQCKYVFWIFFLFSNNKIQSNYTDAKKSCL